MGGSIVLGIWALFLIAKRSLLEPAGVADEATPLLIRRASRTGIL